MTNHTAAQPLDAEVIAKQVASWRADIARLQGLIDHATGSTGAAQPLDLDKLEALERAASPGPWVDGCHTVYQDDSVGGEEICKRMSLEDSAFIAAARNALPVLIAQARAASDGLPELDDDATAQWAADHGAHVAWARADDIYHLIEFTPPTLRDAIAADRRTRAAQPAVSITQPIGHLSPAIGQPESATGATGEDDLPRWIDDQKGKDPLMDDMIAYIIDLRAQLAARGKGEAVAKVDEGDDGLFIEIIYGPDGSPLKCDDKLYLGAPASAQPADRPEAMSYADAAQWCRDNGLKVPPQWEAIAQPDRGAAQGVNIFTCKGKGGEYELIGYSNGAGPKRGESIAVYRDTTKPDILYHRSASDFRDRMEWLGARAPSPASQPVAPEAAHADEVLAFKTAFHAAHGQGAGYDEAVATGLSAARAHAQQEAAPSDAKDAALDAIATAYGYLWHVNAAYGAPPEAEVLSVTPERAAYEARKALRDLLTSEQRGKGINSVRAHLAAMTAAPSSAAGKEGAKRE